MSAGPKINSNRQTLIINASMVGGSVSGAVVARAVKASVMLEIGYCCARFGPSFRLFKMDDAEFITPIIGVSAIVINWTRSRID